MGYFDQQTGVRRRPLNPSAFNGPPRNTGSYGVPGNPMELDWNPSAPDPIWGGGGGNSLSVDETKEFFGGNVPGRIGGPPMARTPMQRGPYQPGMMTGPGAYAQGVQAGGLYNNTEAQNFFGNTGYMPSTTVGGNWGNPGGFNPDNRLSPGQSLDRSGRLGQYADSGGVPLGMMPTTQEGYMEQMMNQNPGGRHFGGLLPTMVHTASGGMRPGFADGPVDASRAPDFSAGRAALMGTDKYQLGPNGQIQPRGYGSPGYQMNPQVKAAEDLFNARRGGVAARQENYQLRTQGMQNFRQGNRIAAGLAKGESGRFRRGELSMQEQAMFGVPGYANASLGLQGMQGMQQLGMAGLQQQGQQQQFQNLAALAQAIPQMGLTPGQQQQYMDHIMRGFGFPGQQGGMGGTQFQGSPQQRVQNALTPKQQGEFRNLKTPQEKEKWLNDNGITDTITRQQLLGVNRQPDMGFGGDVAQSIAGYWPHNWFQPFGLFGGGYARPPRQRPSGAAPAPPHPPGASMPEYSGGSY